MSCHRIALQHKVTLQTFKRTNYRNPAFIVGHKQMRHRAVIVYFPFTVTDGVFVVQQCSWFTKGEKNKWCWATLRAPQILERCFIYAHETWL